MARRHLVIPDTQVTPESNTDHIVWAAHYAVSKRPDVIIFNGDHWDMESLSLYDEGKKSFEGRRYIKDIEAGIAAMKRFVEIIETERERRRKGHRKRWEPRMVFTLGNHENRINRAVEDDPKTEGLMSIEDLKLKEMGFEVYDFLDVVVIDGIAYSHFFTSGVMGRPVSSARALVNKKLMSCVMGHVQDRDIHYARRADGGSITGLFTGIFYREGQGYLTPQTNQSWRGIWLLNDVDDGSFDELPVSLRFLERKYSQFGNRK